MMAMYGFYSRKAAVKYGVVEYEGMDGNPVMVTCVSDDETGEGYKWDDKVCVGQVGRFIREVEAPRVQPKFFG